MIARLQAITIVYSTRRSAFRSSRSRSVRMCCTTMTNAIRVHTTNRLAEPCWWARRRELCVGEIVQALFEILSELSREMSKGKPEGSLRHAALSDMRYR